MFENEAHEANNLEAEIANLNETAFETALRVGEILSPIKKSLEGGFKSWAKEQLTFSVETAYLRVRIFDNRYALSEKKITTLRGAREVLTEPQCNTLHWGSVNRLSSQRFTKEGTLTMEEKIERDKEEIIRRIEKDVEKLILLGGYLEAKERLRSKFGFTTPQNTAMGKEK